MNCSAQVEMHASKWMTRVGLQSHAHPPYLAHMKPDSGYMAPVIASQTPLSLFESLVAILLEQQSSSMNHQRLCSSNLTAGSNLSLQCL